MRSSNLYSGTCVKLGHCPVHLFSSGQANVYDIRASINSALGNRVCESRAGFSGVKPYYNGFGLEMLRNCTTDIISDIYVYVDIYFATDIVGLETGKLRYGFSPLILGRG